MKRLEFILGVAMLANASRASAQDRARRGSARSGTKQRSRNNSQRERMDSWSKSPD